MPSKADIMDFRLKAAIKRSRASSEQLSAMLDFFFENPGIACGKFQKLHGKLEYKKKWDELAAKVNNVGGAVKSADHWRTVWRDLKSRTIGKVRGRKRQQALSGNWPVYQGPITELERRVVTLIGSDYIEGHEPVAESSLMEEELQLSMEGEEEKHIVDVNTDMQFDIPETSAQRISQKCESEEESDTKSKFLEIAQMQADTLKILAESNAANVEINRQMTEAIQKMGEGLKACADALLQVAVSVQEHENLNHPESTEIKAEIIDT